jgi:hypothetical protein
LASLVALLGLMLFMFKAGYEWRRWETTEHHDPSRNEAPIDSLIRKI